MILIENEEYENIDLLEEKPEYMIGCEIKILNE